MCLQCRQFSSSKQALAEAQAAEVKKLGVIGAGQVSKGKSNATTRTNTYRWVSALRWSLHAWQRCRSP